MHSCPPKRFSVVARTNILKSSAVYEQRLSATLEANAERIGVAVSRRVSAHRTAVRDGLRIVRCQHVIAGSPQLSGFRSRMHSLEAFPFSCSFLAQKPQRLLG